MDKPPVGHKKANCPSCGAEVVFKSSVSVFTVCAYCKSMIVRHDMDLEALGTMAEVPDDVSPLKIGTRGRDSSGRFEIIGRLKMSWSEGYWNEWFLLFEDGRHGWLAEAMGFLMLSFEVTKAVKVPEADDIKIGKAYDVAPGRTFFADDIKETTCIASEGELPFQGMSGRTTTSIDLSNSAGEFANIEHSKQDGVSVFIGKYVQFEALDLSNLRDLAADMKKVRASGLFKCPSCGGSVSMLTPGLTAAVVCPYCGSTIDATNQNLQILSKANKKMKIKPLIPIGTAGKLFNAEWEVIGFMRRLDKSGDYFWDEYLLYNPYKGFRWLTVDNGHWNFVEMLHIRPALGPGAAEFQYRDKSFKRFLEGKATVNYVLGEFYWRVKVGDTVGVRDFIAPPEVLSCESDKSEAVWSLGTYVEPQDVKDAFKLQDEMPETSGVAPNQPSPYNQKSSGVLVSFMVLIFCLTALHGIFLVNAHNREIYSQQFTFDPNSGTASGPKNGITPFSDLTQNPAAGQISDTATTHSSAPFDIPGSMGNLAVDLQAPVQNDWLETSIELVEESSQKTFQFEQGVEYYYGTDSDGSWSEGGQSSDVLLSSVPGGRYRLVVQPAAAAALAREKSFTVRLRRNVPVWSNYFLGLLLLSIYPLCLWMKSRSFEARRWSESDFSPYAQPGDDDEGE